MYKIILFFCFFIFSSWLTFASTNEVLFSAVASGDYDTVKSVLKTHPAIHFKITKENFDIGKSDSINIYNTVLDSNQIDIYAKNESGSTLLTIAASQGNYNILNLLIKYENSTRTKQRIEYTEKFDEILDELSLELLKDYLEFYIDDIKNIEMIINTVVYVNSVKEKEKLIQGLKSKYPPSYKGEGIIDLIKQISIEKDEIMFDLITNQNFKNDINNNQETALMVASQNGHEHVLELLLTHKNINFVNKEGNSAVMLAAKNGHKDAVIKLIEKKANLDIKNMHEETASTLALKNKHTNIHNIIDGFQKSSFPQIYLYFKSIF